MQCDGDGDGGGENRGRIRDSILRELLATKMCAYPQFWPSSYTQENEVEWTQKMDCPILQVGEPSLQSSKHKNLYANNKKIAQQWEAFCVRRKVTSSLNPISLSFF